MSDAVAPDMKLTPNVGSDRSWVWTAAADVSEGDSEAVTLAIRFANAESEKRPAFTVIAHLVPDANLFKDAFESAQKENSNLEKESGGDSKS